MENNSVLNTKKNTNELTKEQSKAIQGIGLLFMLALHLFCRKDNLPYEANLYINGLPLMYYLGLWGDQCVALFCFCAGYASYLQQEKCEITDYIKLSGKRLFKLLINYWYVILIFSLISLIMGKGDVMPGSISKFLGNCLLFNVSYNGAWWFMVTYVMLIIISPLLYKMVKNANTVAVFLATGAVYFVSYLVRFNHFNIPDMGRILNWCVTYGALLGTSVLPYIWGMIFYKKKIITRLRKVMEKLPSYVIFLVSFSAFLFCIVTHGIVESLIVAPIYAIITVCIISIWGSKPITFLKFVGEHSTNMWLTHMFFYMVIFENFIFIFKYPIVIYLMMFAVNIAVSFVINFVLRVTVGKMRFLK